MQDSYSSSDEEEYSDEEIEEKIDDINPNDEHGYAKINFYLENLLVILIFISIIVLANIYQELKIVINFFFHFLFIFRFSHILELQLRIYLALYYHHFSTLNF